MPNAHAYDTPVPVLHQLLPTHPPTNLVEQQPIGYGSGPLITNSIGERSSTRRRSRRPRRRLLPLAGSTRGVDVALIAVAALHARLRAPRLVRDLRPADVVHRP